jgi:hypothetical protein
MTAAASQVPITAVLNPASGPGASADPNYANAMTNLEGAGGRVVGYVFTNNGNTPIGTVEGQINTYISQYGSLVNGFYLDGALIQPSTLSYYQSLDSYVKGLSSSYSVLSNPGQPFLNGVAATDYVGTADNQDIFEGPDAAPAPGQPGFNDYPYGLNWFESFPNSKFTNTVYNVPTASAMESDLSKAVGLNAGDVYITDATTPNPYAQLPSYWDQEVAAIADLPEPGSLMILPIVIGALAATRSFRRLAC